MSDLRDPSKPAGAIVEEFDDGGALHNGGVRLKPANENPWYVLATIWGEQKENISIVEIAQLATRNRNTWNKWAKGKLIGEEYAKVLENFRSRQNNPQAQLPDPEKPCDFSHVHFNLSLIVEGFVFSRGVDFREANFSGIADFSKVTFSGTAIFNEARFSKNANFNEATFSEFTDFKAAMFNGDVYFGKASFKGFTDFSLARFGWGPNFREATFSEKVVFNKATFCAMANFSSASFSGETDFDQARFLTHVPEFSDASLYENTAFTLPDRPGENWPPQSGTVRVPGKDEPAKVMPAPNQKRAYSRLRLFYSKTQQIDEEQFFHRQEMRCKREMAKGPTRWLYSLYGLLSDYGISIWRPVVAMLTLIVLGAALLSYHITLQDQPPQASTFWQSMGLSMGWSTANMLPFTGFARTYFGLAFYQALPAWLKVFAGFQTLAAIPLLFLFGLGLRNTFRLR